jgi:glutathione-independent formaldehyde dehydrogenase
VPRSSSSGDLNDERLAQARSFGCETINVGEGTPIEEQIAGIVGDPRWTAPLTRSASRPRPGPARNPRRWSSTSAVDHAGGR